MVEEQIVNNITKDIINKWRKNHVQTLSQICKVKPKYIQKLENISFDYCDFRDGHIVKRHLLKYIHMCNICYFDLENNVIIYLDSMYKPIFVYISFTDSSEIFIANHALEYLDEIITVTIADSHNFSFHNLFEMIDQDFYYKKDTLNYTTLFKLNEPFKLENFNVAVIGTVIMSGVWRYKILKGIVVIRNYEQLITTPGATFEIVMYI